MNWQGWMQTVLNGLLAFGLGYGQAWGSGANPRIATGSGVVAAAAVVGGLFQKAPQGANK